MARSIHLLPFSMVVVAVLAAAAVQACGDDEGISSTVDEDGGKSPDRPDALPFGDDSGPSLSTLRLAHLAPELGTVDFCYQAARAGSFEGPVLQGGGADPDASTDAAIADADADADLPDASNGDAAAPGLAYGTVTKYFTLDASGTITIAIVRAGAKTCENPLASASVTLDPGKLSTVALLGVTPNAPVADAGDAGDPNDDAGAPPVLAFTDDRVTVPDRARVRMIHAAPSGPLTVRVSGATTQAIAENVDPRKVSSASQAIPVDALGFATIAPVAPPASLVVAPLPSDGGPTPAPWTSKPVDLDLRGDSLHTGFVLAGEDGGFEVLWCADKSTTAELTACTILP